MRTATVNPACRRLPNWASPRTPPPTVSNGLPTPCSTRWTPRPEKNCGIAATKSNRSPTSLDYRSPMDACTWARSIARFIALGWRDADPPAWDPPARDPPARNQDALVEARYAKVFRSVRDRARRRVGRERSTGPLDRRVDLWRRCAAHRLGQDRRKIHQRRRQELHCGLEAEARRAAQRAALADASHDDRHSDFVPGVQGISVRRR